jgi:putative ABC transport system permease protein
MAGARGDGVVRRAASAYSVLLRALPSAFRDRHGPEMLDLFRELATEAGTRSGTPGVIRCFTRESLDLLLTAARLRLKRRARANHVLASGLSVASAGPMSHLSHESSDMETIRQDFGYALRAIARRPGFAIVAVLTLGLGIGATTSIFSVVNSVILRPLPYPEPERITMVFTAIPTLGSMRSPHAFGNFIDLQKRARSFEAMAAYTSSSMGTILTGSGAELHSGLQASGSLFKVLGIAPAEGRLFTEAEDEPGAPRTVILSHALATRLSDGRSSMVGKQVTIDRAPHTVIGVMPASFAFPNTTPEYWTPFVQSGERFEERDTYWLTVIGRLRPGVSLESAQAELNAIWAGLIREHPADNDEGTGIALEERQKYVTGDARPVLFMLLGAVGFVLAIACANLANLILARGSTRRRELAVRMALGASRTRLVRQLLTESVVLALLGGVLGVGIAYLGTKVLGQYGPAALPRRWEIGIDTTTLVFTTLIAVASGLLSGLFPALRFSRPDLQEDLTGGTQGAARTRGHRVQRGLVVVQVALALVLLIGAGLLTNSLMRLMTVDPGFDPRNVLVVHIAPAADRYTDPSALDALYARVIERVDAVPGTENVGAAWAPPFSGRQGGTGISIEGTAPSAIDRPNVSMLPVRGDYFATMKLRLIEGRTLTDDDKTAPAPIVINEGMAKRFWPGESAVGKRFRRGVPGDYSAWQTIVGVVADVKESLDTVPGLQGYWPHAQALWARDMSVVVRTSGDPLSLVNAIRAEIRAIDPEIPIVSTSTMEQLVARSVTEPRFRTLLVLSFAGAACLLALVGIYGVMAFVVAERTHEIGVRMALGAEEGGVLRFVLGQGMRLTVLGIVIGIAGALAATRVLRTMLFGVGTTDPMTYGVVIIALGTVAVLACWIPARRASRVDPLVALRAGVG